MSRKHNEPKGIKIMTLTKAHFAEIIAYATNWAYSGEITKSGTTVAEATEILAWREPSVDSDRYARWVVLMHAADRCRDHESLNLHTAALILTRAVFGVDTLTDDLNAALSESATMSRDDLIAAIKRHTPKASETCENVVTFWTETLAGVEKEASPIRIRGFLDLLGLRVRLSF